MGHTTAPKLTIHDTSEMRWTEAMQEHIWWRGKRGGNASLPSNATDGTLSPVTKRKLNPAPKKNTYTAMQASAWAKLAVKARNAKYKHVAICGNEQCQRPGREFVALRAQAKFCSVTCRVAVWRQKRYVEPV